MGCRQVCLQTRGWGGLIIGILFIQLNNHASCLWRFARRRNDFSWAERRMLPMHAPCDHKAQQGRGRSGLVAPTRFLRK